METSKDRADKAFEVLAQFANDMNRDGAQFADRVMREHRTIQQSIFQLFAVVIEEWAKQEHYDQRNAYTIEKSREISKVLDGISAPFI